jgi:hypothetical protein
MAVNEPVTGAAVGNGSPRWTQNNLRDRGYVALQALPGILHTRVMQLRAKLELY